MSAQRARELAAVLDRVAAEDRAVPTRAFESSADEARDPTRRDLLVLGI